MLTLSLQVIYFKCETRVTEDQPARLTRLAPLRESEKDWLGHAKDGPANHSRGTRYRVSQSGP